MNAAKLSIFLVLLCINIIPVAATVQDLLNSYNYNFYNGTINVISQSDYMIDKNSNGKDDTLTISIATDASPGTYKFIVEIVDKNGILINNTQKTISASDFSATINFPSELLSKSKFNYSIRINDNDNNLVFRKSSIESQAYSNYETGANITKITGENANNDFIRINLTVYSPAAKNESITVTLAYNSSKISKTEEKALNSGIQTISIDFDNETIKSTHYKGNFTINNIIIGNKIFDFNKNTSIYNYEDFAKTSYIKSIRDGKIDSNNNNLLEFLEINFTLEIKTSDSYTISYDLYDQFDNFVVNMSKTQSLATGTQNIQTLINGSEIYKTKINGPYVLSFAKLSIGNEIKDIVFDAHTTDLSFYTDYEKPNLPDLKITINTIFNDIKRTTNITINLSNMGNAPAFNIFLDIFDNETYQNNKSLAFLDNNDFAIYYFTAANTSNATLFTAIADFDNLVDETDESNNIVNSLKTGTNDLDGDGISDDIDTLIGNEKSINTTIANLTIKIGNSSDLSQIFDGIKKVEFEDNNITVVEFDFNFSYAAINLSNIIMNKQSDNLTGSFVFSFRNINLPEGFTKTIYVDRIDNAINGICIKDAEITSISQISNNCNGANEVKVECDSTLQSYHTCNYNSTTVKYKITGLNNSGIKQIDYTKPVTSTPTSTTSSGSSSGGGSSSCLESWQCNSWSNCINNLQTRSCQDINNCATVFNKPIETKLCTIEKPAIPGLTGKNIEKGNREPENKAKYSLPSITGFLSGPPENANKSIGALIVLVIIIAGLFGYFRFTYKAD